MDTRNTHMENDAWNPSSVSWTFCVSLISHLQQGWFPFPPIWPDVLLWEGLSPGAQLQYILNLACWPLAAFRTFTGSWCVSLFLIKNKVSLMFSCRRFYLTHSMISLIPWNCSGPLACVEVDTKWVWTCWFRSFRDIGIPVLVPTFWPITRDFLTNYQRHHPQKHQ